MNSNGILLSRFSRGGDLRRGDASAWAVVIWCLFVVAMAVLAIIRPERPITHIYRNAAIDWWSSVPVYTQGIHGFLYFPSSALLLGPLAALPLGLGLHFYGGWLYRPTQMWLKQALTLALLGYPLWLVLTRRSLIAQPVPAN